MTRSIAAALCLIASHAQAHPGHGGLDHLHWPEAVLAASVCLGILAIAVLLRARKG